MKIKKFPGDKITVEIEDKYPDMTEPTSEEPTKPTMTKKTVTEPKNVYLDINKASAEELRQLYGIGEKLSQAIVEYREEHGYFNNIEEIMNVTGIGKKIFESIRSNIFVEDPFYPEEIKPTEEEHHEPPPVSEEPENQERKLEDEIPIDLNTADAETLMLLPYVDEEIAGRIIEVREQIGGFSHVFELLIIEELRQDQVAEIIEYVCINADEEGE